LDAVNIIDPDVALITNVALDHQAWLGNDRESIAREKAGIMRANTPVIYGEADLPQAVSILAQQLGAQLYCYQQEFGYQTTDLGWRWWRGDHTREALPLPALRGDYQLQNAAGVLMAVECLNDRLAVGQAEIRQGLLSAQVAGRFQIIPGAVTTILDVGHNPHAAEVLKKNLLAMESPGKTLAVFGMMADKDIEQLVTIMTPVIDQWLVGGLDTPRAARPGAIAQTLKQAGVDDDRVQQFDHVAQAYQQARQLAGPADRVVVFGSFYTVAAVMAQLAQREDEGAEGRVWNIIASNNG
jgi:dihydrofolate synthase/folylpolyglutamate synthase